MTSVYDWARGYQVAFSYRDIKAEVDALIRMAKATPERVLELASGPAEHAIEFARRGARVTALDLSEAMMSLAVRNASAADVTIEPVRADMRDFTVAYPVDLVTSQFDWSGVPTAT